MLHYLIFAPLLHLLESSFGKIDQPLQRVIVDNGVAHDENEDGDAQAPGWSGSCEVLSLRPAPTTLKSSRKQ